MRFKVQCNFEVHRELTELGSYVAMIKERTFYMKVKLCVIFGKDIVVFQQLNLPQSVLYNSDSSLWPKYFMFSYNVEGFAK